MADYVDLVVGYKKRLQKGCNDEKAMAILHKLKKIPISVEILQETGIGKLVHNMTNNGGEIGATAQNIYKVWKKTVRDSSHSKSKELKHTKSQSDVNKTHKESKSKDVFLENHKGFHNEKVAASNNHNKALQQHQSRSKIDLKNKHKTSDSYKKSLPEYNTYNDFHNADNESENGIITTDYVMQKKTMNHIESSTKLSSHKDQDINKKCKSNANCDKSHKQSREPQKKELSSQPHSSKQKSRTKSNASKLLRSNNESFNSSNASFEDILGLNDTVNPKKKKPQNSLLPNKNNSLDTVKRESTKKSSGVKREASKAFSRTGNDEENEFVMEFKKPRPLPLDVDIDITLPAIQPYYKPLPHKDVDGIAKKKKTTMSNEEAIMFTTPRRDRTAVYAGKRTLIRDKGVPSLFDQCVRVLIENVDGLGYTGGVPYHILKPILQTCSSIQLYRLESCNPELLEDTDELWKIHCERDFKTYRPGEHETWRDLFLRLQDEREQKLRKLKANISASTLVKTENIRSTKLAYLDCVAKPPRDVARRQAKHGTGLPSGLSQKAGPSSKSTPRATAPFINASNSFSSSAQPSFAPVPPKKAKPAPLMQKTLKLFRQHLRR